MRIVVRDLEAYERFLKEKLTRLKGRIGLLPVPWTPCQGVMMEPEVWDAAS